MNIELTEPTEPTENKVKSPLKGLLVRAGDLHVNGESYAGIALQMDRETLANTNVPLYSEVTLFSFDTQAHEIVEFLRSGTPFSTLKKVHSLLQDIANPNPA